MAGRIPKNFIDELLARADVAEVVGRRITLKKAGREYKACCPFHHEKTPSFQVNQQKGFYHCFGCGAHGDALRFIMEYDHLDFVSAVEVLASEMGMTVPRERVSAIQQQREQKQKVEQVQGLTLLAHAAAWFAHNLREHAQRLSVIDYLKKRGVSGSIARDFGIGFAPADVDGLQRAFPDVSVEQWLAVGLVAQREDGKVVDRFRNRIQFPIRDVRGRVVGFGGRIMQVSEHAPKYLNSPETDFFHKGTMLYGLYEMLRAVRHVDRVLVVEGYMDVIALAQFDIRNVVATLGTATTEAHLTLLFKHTQEVVFAFDGDKAGRKAAWKALAIALGQLTAGRSIRFFFLPAQDDPDSYVREHGKSAFLEALEAALTPTEWLVQGLSDFSSMSWRDAEDARRLLFQAQEWLKLAPELSVQYALVQGLARAADMQEWQVERLLGVRTGLAVHRAQKKAIAVAEPMIVKGLTAKMLALLVRYPELAKDWPQADADWLHQYGERGVVVLLSALAGNNARDIEQVEQVFLTQEQASAEWQAGWRQLVCASLENARNALLKMQSNNPIAEQDKERLRHISARLRECHGRSHRSSSG